MYTAILKCLSISEKINNIEDLKNNIAYDILLSNLILIRDIESKIPEKTKNKLHCIDWSMFQDYDNQMNNKLVFNDYEIIYKILKKVLPKLQINLENIIFSQ